MKFSLMIATAALAVVAVTNVTVAQDPVAARQALMKDVGQQSKTVGDMLQGKAAFDAAAAKAALEKLSADAAEFPSHFPAGSDQGDSEAMPAIWTDFADFEARSKKLSDDAAAAAAAVDQGEDAFKAAAGAMFGNCRACHEVYRKPS